jgi:dihydrolipoamide dehydrogenase
MPREVDVAIIGAGSAGLFALSQVRKHTDNFVLIDGGELGTTCARVGCMPSKVIIQVAEDFHRRKLLEREGIDGADHLSVDSGTVMEHVQDLRDVFVDKTLGVTDALDPVHLIEANARFISADTLEVDNEQIRAKAIVIATGSTPIVPDAWQAFGDRVITTDDFFELEELPASMAVIGLGVVGLEIGQSLHRLGVEVTGFDMLDTIAGLSDAEVSQLAIASIGREMPLHLGVAADVVADGERLTVSAGEDAVEVEAVLASLGRRPNLSRLDLAKAGIQLNENGVPDFDPHTMQIGDSPIFIAGDVNADRPILHEAGHEGRVAGSNAARLAKGESVVSYRRKTPMAVTFCDPNIANIGKPLNELDAASTAVATVQFGPVGRALIMGKNRGVLRIYVNKRDGLLLGASMACVKAENLAHLVAWSIQQGMTVFDMLKMPFYHPVIEEALQAALYSVLAELDESHELVELERL